MKMFLHLSNLPNEATAASIREFFRGYAIPGGGIYIPSDGHAFITFSSNNDLLHSISLNGHPLCGQKTTLNICTDKERDTLVNELLYGPPARREPPKFYMRLSNVDLFVKGDDIRIFFGSLSDSIPDNGIVIALENNAPVFYVSFKEQQDFEVAMLMNGRKLKGNIVSIHKSHESEFEMAKKLAPALPVARPPMDMMHAGRDDRLPVSAASAAATYGTLPEYDRGMRDPYSRAVQDPYAQEPPPLPRRESNDIPPRQASSYDDLHRLPGARVRDHNPPLPRSPPRARSPDYDRIPDPQRPYSSRYMDSPPRSPPYESSYGPSSSRGTPRRPPSGYYVMLDMLPSWANEGWIKSFLEEKGLKAGYIATVMHHSKALYAFVQLDSGRDVAIACRLNQTKVGPDILSVTATVVDKVRDNLMNLPSHLTYETCNGQAGEPETPRDPEPAPYRKRSIEDRYSEERGSSLGRARSQSASRDEYENNYAAKRPRHVERSPPRVASKKSERPGSSKQRSSERSSRSAGESSRKRSRNSENRKTHKTWGDYGELDPGRDGEILHVIGLPLGESTITPKDVIAWLAEAPRRYKIIGFFNVFRKPAYEDCPYLVDVLEVKIEKPYKDSLPKMALINGFTARLIHKFQSKTCHGCHLYGHEKPNPENCPAYKGSTKKYYFLENKTNTLLAPSDRGCGISYRGEEHISVEHALYWTQATDLKKTDIADRILEAQMEKRFRDLVGEIHRFDSLNWEVNNYKHLKEIYLKKCDKSYKFRSALAATKGKTILYVSPRFTLGVSVSSLKNAQNIDESSFIGLNMVGKALMEVRDELSPQDTPVDDVIMIDDDDTDVVDDGNANHATGELLKISGLPRKSGDDLSFVSKWLSSEHRNFQILESPKMSTQEEHVSVVVQGPVKNPVLPPFALMGEYPVMISHVNQKRPHCRACFYEGHDAGNPRCEFFKDNKNSVKYVDLDALDELSPNCSKTNIRLGDKSHASVIHAFVWKESQDLSEEGVKGKMTYSTGTMRRRQPCYDADKFKIMQWEMRNSDLWETLYLQRFEESRAFRQALANTLDKEIVFIDGSFTRGFGSASLGKGHVKSIDPAHLVGMNHVGKALMSVREKKKGDPLMPGPKLNDQNNTSQDFTKAVDNRVVSLEKMGVAAMIKFAAMSRQSYIEEEKEEEPIPERDPNLKGPDTYEGPLVYQPLVAYDGEEVVEFEGLPLGPKFKPKLVIEWLRSKPRYLTALEDYNIFTRPPSEISDYEVYVMAVRVRKPIDPVLEKKVAINGSICKVSHTTQLNGEACIACRQVGHRRQDEHMCPAYIKRSNVHFIENIRTDLLSPVCMDEKVEYEGYHHLSLNHAYTWKEAMDLGREDIAEKIKTAIENKEFQSLFNKLHMYDSLNWEYCSYSFLKELYMYKWHNSETFRHALLATENKPIKFIHATITRGIGLTGMKKVQSIKPEYYPGFNLVGCVLEEIRAEMRHTVGDKTAGGDTDQIYAEDSMELEEQIMDILE